MNGPPWPPAPPESPSRDAGRAFMSGFAGYLGVGLAVVFVLAALVILVAAMGHH